MAERSKAHGSGPCWQQHLAHLRESSFAHAMCAAHVRKSVGSNPTVVTLLSACDTVVTLLSATLRVADAHLSHPTCMPTCNAVHASIPLTNTAPRSPTLAAVALSYQNRAAARGACAERPRTSAPPSRPRCPNGTNAPLLAPARPSALARAAAAAVHASWRSSPVALVKLLLSCSRSQRARRLRGARAATTPTTTLQRVALGALQSAVRDLRSKTASEGAAPRGLQARQRWSRSAEARLAQLKRRRVAQLEASLRSCSSAPPALRAETAAGCSRAEGGCRLLVSSSRAPPFVRGCRSGG